MKPTHDLYAEEDCIAVSGNGNYFSWIIEIEDNEFILSTHYGKYMETFSTLKRALDYIGYHA